VLEHHIGRDQVECAIAERQRLDVTLRAKPEERMPAQRGEIEIDADSDAARDRQVDLPMSLREPWRKHIVPAADVEPSTAFRERGPQESSIWELRVLETGNDDSPEPPVQAVRPFSKRFAESYGLHEAVG